MCIGITAVYFIFSLSSWCTIEAESIVKVYEKRGIGSLYYCTFQITHIFVDDGGIAKRLESCGDLSSQVS